METTTLSSKGQIIIPKPIRESHHWQPGTEFEVEDTGTEIILRLRKPFPTTRLEDGLGCAGYEGPVKSIEEMEEGITEELRKQWRHRGRK